MGQKAKEQEYINDLEARVESEYLETKRNIPYSNRGRQGELDFMGLRPDNTWDIYEVKATSKKGALYTAMNQLDRARHYAPYTVDETYIYIGREEELIYYRGD